VRDLRRKGGVVGPAPVQGGAEGQQQAALAPLGTPPDPDARPNAQPAATEPELAQLKYLINSKRRALADLEESRARRLAELTTQLQEQKVQYADQHPVVLDTMSRIEAVKEDSPQMMQVKSDIEQLLAEYTRKGGRHPESLVEPSRTQAPRRLISQAGISAAELADDPMVEFARNNLRVAAAKYEELMMRIDAARIEQDTARAAFKYRYSVVRPASVPKKPLRPDATVLLIGVVLAALLAALFAGATRDVLRARFVEAWQVERTLGLKVLSHVRAKALEDVPDHQELPADAGKAAAT
jgi:hypothetical protein